MIMPSSFTRSRRKTRFPGTAGCHHEFTDLPVEDRIARIAAAGHQWAECLFHDATFDGKKLNKALGKNAALPIIRLSPSRSTESS
jgi:hydroxypyruvate isomerase